jgi:cyanophycinase
MAAVVRASRFIYLAGGSPLHLKSVLKGSATFEALRDAWAAGAVVAGSAAGAMVLTDPMVDPRGGALTVGLGLISQLAVVPRFGDHHDDVHGQKLERTVALAYDGLPVVSIPERSALIRQPDGAWSAEGERSPVVYLNGSRTDGLEALGA